MGRSASILPPLRRGRTGGSSGADFARGPAHCEALYMAPEQASGRSREAGPAADVHALGAILYELLIGRPPFRAASLLETLEQVKTVDPVVPTHMVRDIPRDLE